MYTFKKAKVQECIPWSKETTNSSGNNYIYKTKFEKLDMANVHIYLKIFTSLSNNSLEY